ncbi:MAG: SDR family oxidoreductase [Cyclobacteriaceae bacterium]
MKFILITGVSTGIGYDLTKAFIKSGYHVLGSVRKSEDAERLSNEFGANFTALLFDVTDQAAIQNSLASVKATVGENGLAGLINNAGIALSGPTQLLPLETFRYQLEVNLFGAIAVTQTFLELLGAKKDCPHPPGKILNISSVSGKLAFPFLGPYNASKFALEGWSHALRRELLGFGIDVIIIGPGAIKTPIWDKALNADLPKEWEDTPYYRPMQRIKKEFTKQEAKAMPSEVLSNKVLKVFESSNPKTRYSFLNNKFFDFTIPSMLPDRVMDKFIKKLFKIN